jgi:transcriptional regulator with PAS, ATPase and Fis domain
LCLRPRRRGGHLLHRDAIERDERVPQLIAVEVLVVTSVPSFPEIEEERILPGWALSEWADRLLEQVGVGVTIVDRQGNVLYYNKWASEHLDRKPGYIGDDVRNRHRRAITNPRFDAMIKLFEDGRTEPVRYVARPYGKTTILVTVSPIFVSDELVGFSQIVLLKNEVQELCARFDESGRESFEREMLPNGAPQSVAPREARSR